MPSPLQQHAAKVMDLMKSGNFAQAAKTAKAGMKKFPKESNFANIAGMALAQMGNAREAVPYFLSAIKAAPREIAPQDNLIRALVTSGQHDKANDYINKYLPTRQNPAQLLFLRALSQERQLDPEAVMKTATSAIEADPNFAPAYNIRGIAHNDLDMNAEAVSDFEKALALNPNDPDPLVNIAVPLERLNRSEDARAALTRALEIRPDYPLAMHKLAIYLTFSGDLENAGAQYLKLLQRDPMNGEAYAELVLAQPLEKNEELKPGLETALIKTPKSSPQYAHMNLAMANILFQEGEFKRASRHFDIANSWEAKARKYDPAVDQEIFDKIVERFPVGGEFPTGDDIDKPAPIFVVGLPRSGTTLTEMILTAHPDVQSCGELAAGNLLVTPVLEDETTFDPKAFAQDFRDMVPAMPDGKQAFVDKLPSNYRLVGFLMQAFPEARFVNVARDPRDVALSMWRNYFPSGKMSFTYNLKHMAGFANLYRRYWNHWEQIYGDRLLTINYADIVSDVEAAGKKMANYCGIEWVPEMASPERNKAKVRTASLVQVRQKVHRKSVGGWRDMEEALKPFTDALDKDLWSDFLSN